MFAIADLCARIRLPDVSTRGRALLGEYGPYVLIELLLPGGSLIALLLWLYSRHKNGKPFFQLRLRTITAEPAASAVASEAGRTCRASLCM